MTQVASNDTVCSAEQNDVETCSRLEGKRPRICIVAHFSHGALVDDASGHIGGVEKQTALTARWLAARGHDVSLVTWDEGQLDGQLVDRVRLLKLCRANAGLPGLRFFWPRWTSLCAALRRADAEVYYQNTAECVTGQTAIWCRRNGRGFVFSAASNADVDHRLPILTTRRERWLYRRGLRLAGALIVQTTAQQRMLNTGFGLDADVIPMPCPGPSDEEYSPPEPSAARSRVLWVGRICEHKRPDRLLEVARACPDLQFDMIGPAEERDAYAQHWVAQAVAVKNVHVRGGVPRAQMTDLYQKAACLCCTSDLEGFPNTFLEAWSHGIPVISTFDPDGVIAAHKLGIAADEMDGVIRGLRSMLSCDNTWRESSRNARAYYSGRHAIDAVMPRFAAVFQRVARATGPAISKRQGDSQLARCTASEAGH